MSMPKAMSRGYAIPLDASSVWYSYDEMANYAKNSPIAYVGQILSLVTEQETITYIIENVSGNLKKLGNNNNADILTDGESIEATDGCLSLKNWKKKYQKWVASEDGTNGHYEEVILEEEAPWISGLEPKVLNNELVWYEPNPTLKNSITELAAIIGTKEDAAEDDTIYGSIAALEFDIQKNTDNIALLQEETKQLLPLVGGTMTGDIILPDGYKAASEKVVDIKIAAALETAGHLNRVIVDRLPPVEEANSDTIYMVLDPLATEGNIYEEYMLIENFWEKIGDTKVDLTNYLQKVPNAIENNVVVFGTDGALLDGGIGVEALNSHLNNIDIHLTEKDRQDFSNLAESVEALEASAITRQYEIFQKPQDALVRYSDAEIRVMVPKDHVWEKQTVGSTGNPNMYYMGFKAYAPAGAAFFKEGDQGVIEDVFYDFNGDFAGTDQYGRNYSVVWLALANYDSATDTWNYFGKNSTKQRYIGWTYVVEWYDENKERISDGVIKITLSNEECHSNAEPYYMGSVVKEIKINGAALAVTNNAVQLTTADFISSSDEIAVNEEKGLEIKQLSVSKLYVPDEEELVFNSGNSEIKK